MLVPLSWLRDFAPFDLRPDELAWTFDNLGMVVEGMTKVGEGLEGVVVAKVLEIRPIVGADKIRHVVVDAGDPDPVEVVCGAWNFGEGDVVPLARVGAVLPGGFEIGRRKMKGVVSNGMICSARELELGDDHNGILVLPPALEVGAPFAEAVGIHADVVYDLAIESNRPDAMCVAGVARDAAAKLGLPFAIPDPPPAPRAVSDPVATVVVESPELCPRFTATVLTDLPAGSSPAWLVRRLTLAGMRSISPVVDASNYVMLELGQPTHPYDLDRLPGRGLLVRAATVGERLVTLDGAERVLGGGPHPDCLICDAEGTPVGIAGIMGGASSEIADDTTTVLLEAAYFDRMAVARTSKRIGLRSEASARFERGCDPLGIDRAVARIVELLAGTAAGPTVDVEHGEHYPPRGPIRLRTARVNAILGTDLGDDEIRRHLTPIGFAAEPSGAGLHDVTIPSFRPDADSEIDVIEEVARHHGYDNIARTVPASPRVGALSPYQRDRRLVRELLIGAGVSEAVGPLLLGPGDHARAGLGEQAGAVIEAEDPLAREESILRTSLRPGLLRAIAFNAGHRNPDVRFFEIGHVYRPPLPSDDLPDERERLAVAVAGEGADAAHAVRLLRLMVDTLRLDALDFAAVEESGLHPTRTAEIRAGDVAVGVVGEVAAEVLAAHGIDGRVGWLDVDLEVLLGLARRDDAMRPISRFPSADIDLAFVVPEDVSATAVARTLEAAGRPLLEWVRLFDVFRGPSVGGGARSLAYRLRFCALDRTLTDEDIAAARARCIAAVESSHSARLRG